MNIGIKEENRKEVAEKLNVFLASSYMLQVKIQNFHWNTEGPHFPILHKMFEEQYDQISESIDEIAERIRVLGQYAAGSMQDFQKLSILEEAPSKLTETAMLKALLHDHEAITSFARDAAGFAGAQGDAGSEDFLISRIQMHEKTAWMLRATLNVENM